MCVVREVQTCVGGLAYMCLGVCGLMYVCIGVCVSIGVVQSSRLLTAVPAARAVVLQEAEHHVHRPQLPNHVQA